MSKLLRTLFLAASITTVFASLSHATEGISTVNVATTAGTASTAEGVTFSNNVEALTGFTTTSGAAYTVASSAPNALVQRNTATTNNNQSSVWYASNSTGFAGVHQSTYGAMLKSNNFYAGADNVFDNGTAAASGNIERLDFTWGQAFSADLSTVAFAVFDRGVATAHDAFTIAIVTGVNASGVPTSYGGFLKIAANWGAATNPVGDQAYNLFRYAAGDDISASTAHNENGTQGVGGIVIKASEFGLAAGTKVYGYSLMGGDVNPGTANDLLTVTNTTVYPTNTADANGGIDLAAVNGLEIHAVPEPAAWVLLGAGGALLGGLYRRRRA